MRERPRMVAFRLTDSEYDALNRASLMSGVGRSSLIRLKLLECIAQHMKTPENPNQTELFGK